MNFTQKIYYNDKPIILCEDTEAFILTNPEAWPYSIIDGYSEENLKTALTNLEDVGCQGVLIREKAPQISFLQLKAKFKVVPAGGGLVTNANSDLLMIFRRGKWDLPKGKQDEGETIEACSLREIREETGLTHLELGQEICETYHIYNEKGKKAIKYTTWFHMKNTASENLVAQAEEDIEEARWVNRNNLSSFMSNTYSAIKEVMLAAGMRW